MDSSSFRHLKCRLAMDWYNNCYSDNKSFQTCIDFTFTLIQK